MPMHWTPENDRLLLLKILEVCKVDLDVNEIAKRWPTGQDEGGPTPRAIRERLTKIRTMARSGGGNFSISTAGKSKGMTKDSAKAKTTATRPRAPKKVKQEISDVEDSAMIKKENVEMNGLGEVEEQPLASSGSDYEQYQPLTPTSLKRKRSFDAGVRVEVPFPHDDEFYNANPSPSAKYTPMSGAGTQSTPLQDFMNGSLTEYGIGIQNTCFNQDEA